MNNNQMTEEDKKQFIILQNNKLLKAIDNHNNIKIKKAIKNGATITTSNYALQYACNQENIEAINILIDNGSPIQNTDNDVLKKILLNNNLVIAELLISKGADVNFNNGHILEALIMGDKQKIIDFLINKDVDIQLNHNNALTVAVLEKNFPIIKQLLSLGADIELGNNGPFVSAIKMQIVEKQTNKIINELQLYQQDFMYGLTVKSEYGVDYKKAIKKVYENDIEINILEYLLEKTPTIDFNKIENNTHIPEDFKKELLSKLLEKKLTNTLIVNETNPKKHKI